MSDQPLLRVDRHQWGPGAIHLLNQEWDKTLCGKERKWCPGKRYFGDLEEATQQWRTEG
jgi:hypothetical protein